jgi:hypothetical protein
MRSRYLAGGKADDTIYTLVIIRLCISENAKRVQDAGLLIPSEPSTICRTEFFKIKYF